MSGAQSTPRSRTRSTSSPTAASEPRKHTSKACERCRNRRIKCIGGIPCSACTKADCTADCQVRSVPRPKRHLSRASHEVEIKLASPAAVAEPFSEPVYTLPSDTLSFNNADFLFDPGSQSSAFSQPINLPIPKSSNPLTQIEDALSIWCRQNNITVAPLLFNNQSRLSTLIADPLPAQPIRATFEDGLITHLITTADFEQHSRELKTIDRPRLLSLYGRYRAVPNSLTDDQRAFIYASLCLARHTQSTTPPTAESGRADRTSREDLTYYRMACEALATWNRASIYAVWALFCLIPYSTALGGPAESADLLRQMGSQIRELGLYRISAAQWYAPEDMVQVMFSAYLYMDLLRASLTDLQTFVPLADIEVDSTPPSTFVLENLRQASRDAMTLLKDSADPLLDVTSDQYVAATESRWEAVLGVLRHERSAGTAKIKGGWAMIRYHWMRILLHYPRSSNGNPLSSIILARSVTQIIHIYSQLASYGYLNPSWPQLRRISVCGHLLILLTSIGEIGVFEANNLLPLLFTLLDGHMGLWPIVTDMKSAYRQAAQVLGLSVPNIDQLGGIVQQSTGFTPPVTESEAMAWQNLSLMFDPTYFLSMTHDDLAR